jgi:endonuclease/exonuclease/phosphatase (EEP) superfamily protein YafD
MKLLLDAVGRTLWLIVFAAVAGVATAVLGRFDWRLELASHFQVQYLAILVIGVVAVVALRRWKILPVPGLALAACVWLILPFAPTRSNRQEPESIRIAFLNLLNGNTHYQAVRDFIKREDPDIFACVEIDARWERELRPVLIEYPNSKTVPRPDDFGVALFSKLPAQGFRFHRLGELGVPCLEASFSAGKNRFQVLVAHTLPPVGSRNAAERNRELVELGQLAASSDGDSIVVGDLNASPWSPYFRDLLQFGNLRSGRRGFGLQPTWPTWNPLLLIPIDHLLVSPGLRVFTHHTFSRPLGSDHRPLVMSVALR